MGTSYSIGCMDCGYTLELRKGVGMMFYDHERILQLLPKKGAAESPGTHQGERCCAGRIQL